MKRLFSDACFLAFLTGIILAVGAIAQAQDAADNAQTGRAREKDQYFLHEVTGGTDSSFIFGGGNTTVGAALGYRYYLLPDIGLQIGWDTDFQYKTSGNEGVTTWTNFFGVRYNLRQLSNRQLNQFFVDLGAGFQLNHASVGNFSQSESNFLWGLGIGKRFGLFDNVAWIPEISETHVNNQGWTLTITPVAVSVFLSGPY